MKSPTLLLGVLLLASCSGLLNPVSRRIRDGGFLSSQPCGSPCFWNITPGTSTFDQAVQELRAHGVYEYCQFRSPPDSDFDFLSCGFDISIAFQEGSPVVRSIAFYPSKPITVEDAVASLGAPAWVCVIPPLLPDHPIVFASLFFSDSRVVLSLESQDARSYSVELTTRVNGITYRSVEERSRPLDCQEWTGYSEYAAPTWPGSW